MTQIKATGNRVTIYYPARVEGNNHYGDYKWAYDGEDSMKGLMRFGADILPQGPFRHLQGVR